jgi:hypothetical protein
MLRDEIFENTEAFRKAQIRFTSNGNSSVQDERKSTEPPDPA